jgi:hypothetical protein
MSSRILYSKSRVKNRELKNQGRSLLHRVEALLTTITAHQSTNSKDQSLQVIQFHLGTVVSLLTPIHSHKGTTQEAQASSTMLPWFHKMRSKK